MAKAPEVSTLKALERGEKFGTLSAEQKEELAALRSGALCIVLIREQQRAAFSSSFNIKICSRCCCRLVRRGRKRSASSSGSSTGGRGRRESWGERGRGGAKADDG